jgi:hypothetical protein
MSQLRASLNQTNHTDDGVETHRHEAVRTALKGLTNRDFGFNQQNWRQWWETESPKR